MSSLASNVLIVGRALMLVISLRFIGKSARVTELR